MTTSTSRPVRTRARPMAPEERREHLIDVKVSGKNGLGEHATSTVTLALPKGGK